MDWRGLTVLLTCAFVANCYDGNAEIRLWKKIVQNSSHQMMHRPTTNHQKGTKVVMDIYLLTLTDYEPRRETILVGYYLKLYWNIPWAKWNPEDYGGLKDIYVYSKDLWTPDVLPYVHYGDEHTGDERVVIGSSGNAIFVFLARTTASCFRMLNGPSFPRDQVRCNIPFGSWIYHGQKLNLTLKNAKNLEIPDDLDAQLLSSGWKFVNASLQRQVTIYSCCPEPFITAPLDIIIQRKDVYFYLAVSVPGAVTGLSVALLHLLDPKSPARLISQTLCLLIFINLAISDVNMMETSVVLSPSGFYIIGAIILNLLAITWSIIATIIWTHCSMANSALENMICKLEYIFNPLCKRMRINIYNTENQDADQLVNSNDMSCHNTTKPQRLCIVLDRLFSVITLIIFLLLFHKLAG